MLDDPGTTEEGVMRVLRIAAVKDRVGLSRTSIWRLERQGLFPRRRQLSANAVGWSEEDIDDWLRSRGFGADD
jgi:prophage regulatory protein